jgi:hypothetical protein
LETLAFAYPVTDQAALQRLKDHMASDSAAERVHSKHREHGIMEVTVFLQEQPSQQLIVVVQGENLKQASKNRHGSEEVKHLNKLIQDATGTNPEIHADAQPRQVHHWES